MTGENAQKIPAADSSTQVQQSDSRRTLHPGDEAAPGTPSTGENICPQCEGKGRIDGAPCPNCAGSGKVVRGIGGG
jgi:DnaJ-class molecular chaperone